MGDINKDLTLSATTEGFPEAKAQVDALGDSVKGAATGTEKLGAAAAGGKQSFDEWRAGITASINEAHNLAAGATAAAEGVTLFSRAIAFLSGPIGIAIAAFALLATHLEGIGNWFGKIGDGLDRWVNGVGAATPVLDAHGKVLDELAQGYNKAATAQDLHTRALALERLGVIGATDDLKVLDAEALVHEANFRKSTEVTEDLAAAFKKLGITIPESFDTLQKKGDEFLARYQIIFDQDGPAAARVFAEANKSTVDTVITRYEKMGTDVPPALKKLADGLGLVSSAEAEAAKDKGLADRYTKDLRKMADESADLLKKVSNLGDEFLKTRDKIETAAKAEIAANDQKTAATIADLQKQVAEVQAAYAARTISDTEYNTKINALFSQEQKARSDGFDKEKTIQTEEEAALKKNVEARDQAGKEIIDKLDDIGDKQVETAKKLGQLNEKIDAQKESTAKAAQGFQGLSTQFGLTGSDAISLGNTVSGLDALMDKLATERVPVVLHAFDLIIDKLKQIQVAATAAGSALNNLDGGVSGE